MKKPDFKGIAKNVSSTLKKNAPEIMTGVGIAGMATSVILAVKATPKAKKKIDVEEEKIYRPLKPIEKVKVAWKDYVPCTITFVLSSVCVIGATSENNRRKAALAAAYSITQNAFDDYKREVVETIGEKKSQELESKASIKRAERSENNDIIVTPYGDYLCQEDYTGLIFRSTVDKINAAMRAMNQQIKTEGEGISLNDLYIELGLPVSPLGSSVGWSYRDFKNGEELRVYDNYYKTKNGEPCYIFSYSINPHPGYNSVF